MAPASISTVNADAALPPLGPFATSRDELAHWGDPVILALIALGLSLGAVVAIAAGFFGSVL